MTEREHDETSDDVPATPQLTEAQSKRLSQPMIGILISVAVCVGAVAALMLLNPSPEPEPFTPDEDVVAAADSAAGVVDYAPLAPEVPEGWTANYARWKGGQDADVPYWEVGYTTDETAFVGFAQTDAANPTWISQEVEQAPEVGSITVEGVVLQIRRDEDDRRVHYVLDAEQNPADATTVVISGDAGEEEFDAALRAIIDGLGQQPAETTDPADEESDD